MSSLIVGITGNSVMEQNVLAVKAAYDALTLATKVTNGSGDPPTWLFGRTNLHFNIGPPRVTWVPESGSIEGPKNVGGGLADGGTTVKARSLVDRLLNFQVYCNGISYEQTENIMVSVIAATRAALGVGTEFGNEVWPTEQIDTADNALNKIEVVLDVAIRMPVLDESGTLAVITTQTHTEILDPDLDC